LQANILVKGIVQGVGFRPFVYRLASAKKLKGFVQNRGDAGVQIVLEGDSPSIESFVAELRSKRPPLSEIHELRVNYKEVKSDYTTFEIRDSFKGGNERGSTIPPDISICKHCLREMYDVGNRRYRYFFITCTDCGPRYTLIRSVPYDRINTSMNSFQMCSDCKKEYASQADRRFHSQTNACPKCGPRLVIENNRGEILECADHTFEAGRLLDEGNILAVKGNGGFHLVCSTTNSAPLHRLRAVKERKAKPFAVMVKNLESARDFAEISEFEAEILESPSKPIVLLRKNVRYFLSELVSPGLHTIGVMLPYSGLHHLLFDSTKEPALVMTSANPPNEPIIIEDSVAVRRLGNVTDYFLIHNRQIEQRCDDTVLRAIGRTRAFVRRSRGYAPAPIAIGHISKRDVIALGAELNVACCILIGSNAYLSQHIGDVETPSTLSFLEEVVRHLLGLTKAEPRAIACDLHPRFSTTFLGKRLSNRWDIPLVQVQHHHAHLSKLMCEHGVREAVGVVCDGYGYGPDGSAWGGEVLYSDINTFERLGHLQEQPMVGGDLATKYPLRMTAGMLSDPVDARKLLMKNVDHIPHGSSEIDIIMKQLESGKTLTTTSSCGRVLDAVSSLLGLCYERTYEGEPALRLEAAATQGKDILRLEPKIVRDIVDTSYLVSQIHKHVGKTRAQDLAISAQSYLARSLAQLALKCASSKGISTVGFTGGVACNDYLSRTIRSIVEASGLTFLSHNSVPPGDGGISLGQAIIAAEK
jgi:hydrogenase maturation protein HypF